MQIGDVVRRFSKTPLKHRMSKYLLEYLLENQDLLSRVQFVTTRASLSDTMIVAQAGADGPSFELELGAEDRDEVSLVNGRLVKQTKRNRAYWVHDPVQAVEVLRKFSGILHVQFVFLGCAPHWYDVVTNGFEKESCPDFSQVIQEQTELAISGIILKAEVDLALREGNKDVFYEKVKAYKEVCNSCLWEL